MNWVCIAGGITAPLGHPSLIDEVPYAGSICELAGSRRSSDIRAGWPMNWDTSTQHPDCCHERQGRDR